jgi:hypothetical protein
MIIDFRSLNYGGIDKFKEYIRLREDGKLIRDIQFSSEYPTWYLECETRVECNVNWSKFTPTLFRIGTANKNIDYQIEYIESEYLVHINQTI